ncbi:MAG: GNAT family N-acetyltransferase [Acidobacteriota bacterium]|nr:GNAT family N-acetyltransferase [Acidobacteriota bacterium]
MTDFRTEPLSYRHNLSAFNCGVESLDSWLRTHAVRAGRADTARTYVWAEPGSLTVVAYYAIAPTQVRREDVSRSMTGGIGVVPGYLLARLAIDHSLQGRGLGGQLLRDALEVIVSAATQAAGRLIVVDAIDDVAAAFYRHYDFRPVAGNPRRLVMKITTARQALLPAGPPRQ